MVSSSAFSGRCAAWKPSFPVRSTGPSPPVKMSEICGLKISSTTPPGSKTPGVRGAGVGGSGASSLASESTRCCTSGGRRRYSGSDMSWSSSRFFSTERGGAAGGDAFGASGLPWGTRTSRVLLTDALTELPCLLVNLISRRDEAPLAHGDVDLIHQPLETLHRIRRVLGGGRVREIRLEPFDGGLGGAARANELRQSRDRAYQLVIGLDELHLRWRHPLREDGLRSTSEHAFLVRVLDQLHELQPRERTFVEHGHRAVSHRPLEKGRGLAEHHLLLGSEFALLPSVLAGECGGDRDQFRVLDLVHVLVVEEFVRGLDDSWGDTLERWDMPLSVQSPRW